ncbi:hypothetical protein UPYG_G00033430 [Umbra pygmaea]|uniref:Ubiquitin-like protease family profile domain-containing protein n=1 Tax=Umbra pygmaea TaxID=75934 RepID=A0ABD0YAC0_UMBPY
MVHNGSTPQAPLPPPPTPPLPTQVGINGRSSGRKRTPKACDCCGPNSKHHDGKSPHGKTPGGKPRQRQVHLGKGRGQTLGETPKRKTAVQPVADSEMAQDKVSKRASCEAEQAPRLEQDSGSDKLLLTDNKMDVVKQPRSRSRKAVVSMSNGTSPVPREEPTDCSTPMEVEPSDTSCAPSGIILCSILHPFALQDHRDYCKMGVWAPSPESEVGSALDRAHQTQVSSPQSKSEDRACVGTRDLIHEFLECFYVKYGSFIPLSETDVMEHLKIKCNADLNAKELNIKSEVAKYKAGLASSPMNFFKVDYNKHSLTLEDLSTLDDQNWVNDQVINMYGELIMEATQHKVHFFNSFFHRQLVAKGYEGVKRWTKKVDLFSKSLLLIPIHLEIHWSLITVDIANHNINYYDSQGIVFKYTIENIMRYILAEAKEKKQAGYQKGWKMIINKSIPQQKNDSDCGVFVLEYCKCLALKEPLKFTQNDMPKVRKRIYKELCDCKLTNQSSTENKPLA